VKGEILAVGFGLYNQVTNKGGVVMPVIVVRMFAGRTKQQKADLAKAITDSVVRIAKTTPEATEIVFEDIVKENWAVGGVLCSDK
jgi:4-oxalocrotonate tautomerase